MKNIILIVAGGPSIRQLNLSLAKNFRTIAVNSAYEIAPWAEEMFFSDKTWWNANKKQLLASKFTGEVATSFFLKDCPPEYRYIKHYDGVQHLDDPNLVSGPDSGSKAICRAFHRGAKTILLAGFDCKRDEKGRSHYHNNYLNWRGDKQWEAFRQRHLELYKALRKRHVDVYSVTKNGHVEISHKELETFNESFANLRCRDAERADK